MPALGSPLEDIEAGPSTSKLVLVRQPGGWKRSRDDEPKSDDHQLPT